MAPSSTSPEFELANPSDPDAFIVDLDNTDDAARTIQGTTADLIRDGYNESHQWMMNAHADPNACKPAFLIGRGWSATPGKRRRIADADIPVMAVNDYPADGPKPTYWCSGDGATSFGNRIWDDAEVMKFSPLVNKSVSCPRTDAYETRKTALDCPNVHFFHKVNDLLSLDEWLFVPYIAWGTTIHGKNVPKQFHKEGAARSSMLIGLRILWHLGYRKVYLLGCDCTPHHHPAPKYWKVMFSYIDQLKPAFDRFCYSVYQTNPDSHLRTFEFAEFDRAVA